MWAWIVYMIWLSLLLYVSANFEKGRVCMRLTWSFEPLNSILGSSEFLLWKILNFIKCFFSESVILIIWFFFSWFGNQVITFKNFFGCWTSIASEFTPHLVDFFVPKYGFPWIYSIRLSEKFVRSLWTNFLANPILGGCCDSKV